MGDKIMQFLGNHFEKLLLPVFGLLIIWLLLTKVVISPNRVEVGAEKRDAWRVDRDLRKQAADLQIELEAEPVAKPPYAAMAPKLSGIYDSALGGSTGYIAPPIPQTTSIELAVGGEYDIPVVGPLTDVAVGYVRATAYVPTEKVTLKLTYNDAPHEPNDVDFVSVQASYDIEGLVERFEESFVGQDVKLDWRDETMAKPIFAAVALERQEFTTGLGWGQWVAVPRTNIDHLRDMFTIETDASRLPPGALRVMMLQFDDVAVQSSLLQPISYQIASAREEWFPPEMHARFAKLRDEQLLQEVRDAQLKERDDAQRLRDTQRSGGLDEGGYGTGSGRTGTGSGRTGTGSGRTGGGRTQGTSSRRGGTSTRQQGTSRTTTPYGTGRTGVLGAPGVETVDTIYREYKAIMIPDRTEITKLASPLVIWAHDDTVRPGSTYRYRMRVGVFNPIGGTNKFRDKTAPEKNSSVLWSDYTEVTDPVTIASRFYLFASDIQSAANIVGVEVAKFEMGYWRSESFKVRCGESIGSIVEQEKEKPKPSAMGLGTGLFPGDGYGGGMTVLNDDLTMPDEIDFRTGAVFVDVATVNDWTTGRNMRPRQYYEMLYSYDGANIEHLPIGGTYWPAQLQVARASILKLQQNPIEPLRDWDSQIGGRSGTRRGGTSGTDTEMYEEMMMEEYGEMYR